MEDAVCEDSCRYRLSQAEGACGCQRRWGKKWPPPGTSQKLNDAMRHPALCLVHGQWSINADSFHFYELGTKRQNVGGPSSHPGNWTARSGLKVPDAQSCPTPQAVCVLGHTPWAALPGRKAARPCSRAPSPPWEAPSTCLFPAARPACPAGLHQTHTGPHVSAFICPCLCFLANKCHVFPTGLLSSQFIVTLCGQGQVSALRPALFSAPSKPVLPCDSEAPGLG